MYRERQFPSYGARLCAKRQPQRFPARSCLVLARCGWSGRHSRAPGEDCCPGSGNAVGIQGGGERWQRGGEANPSEWTDLA